MNASTQVTFSAVLLAAGTSTRMQGRHKLMLEIDGEPAVRRTARALLGATPKELVVVTGFNSRAVIEALEGLPLRFQLNPYYEQGQMTSVGAGVAALTEPCDAVMVCLADQVLLASEDYRELIDAYALMPRGSILVPMCAGRRGNPVVFSVGHAAEVVSGNVNPGCKKLIQEHPEEVFVYEANHDRFAVDMDTPEDYAAVLARLDSTSASSCKPTATRSSRIQR